MKVLKVSERGKARSRLNEEIKKRMEGELERLQGGSEPRAEGRGKSSPIKFAR